MTDYVNTFVTLCDGKIDITDVAPRNCKFVTLYDFMTAALESLEDGASDATESPQVDLAAYFDYDDLPMHPQAREFLEAFAKHHGRVNPLDWELYEFAGMKYSILSEGTITPGWDDWEYWAFKRFDKIAKLTKATKRGVRS